MLSLVIEDVGEGVEPGSLGDGVDGGRVGLDGPKGRIEGLAAEGEGLAHRGVRCPQKDERIDFPRQPDAQHAVGVAVAELAAPWIDVRCDEPAYRTVLALFPRLLDAVTLEIAGQLYGIGVVSAARVGGLSHAGAQKLLLDAAALDLVARALEKQRVVELVGQLL